MRIVHGDQIEEKIRIHQHRQGMFRYRTVAAGEPGTPGNFILEMVRTTDDFFSPRHKHNFDQFRYQLEGEFDFDRNGKMTPGIIGYFPEGTPYGPQSSSVSSLTLVLQFGGASGNGYMTQQQMEAGTAELKKHGTFEKGVFRRNDGEDGKRNVDGYQAVWEHVNNRPMTYPAPRYHEPIMMSPDHFDWVPVEGVPGVCEKRWASSPREAARHAFCVLRRKPGCRHPDARFISCSPATDGSAANPIVTTPRCSANGARKQPSRPRRRPRFSFSGYPNSTRRRTTASPRNNSARERSGTAEASAPAPPSSGLASR